MANVKVEEEEEEEEGLTEVEKRRRKLEEDYSDITLKSEDVNAWPELSDTLTKRDGDEIDAHYQNIDTILVLVSFFVRRLFSFSKYVFLSFSLVCSPPSSQRS